jgi:hypothetical protein
MEENEGRRKVTKNEKKMDKSEEPKKKQTQGEQGRDKG